MDVVQFAIPKSGAIAGVTAGLVSAVVAGVYGFEWWSHDRDAALVVATVRVDPTRCTDPDLPVWFEVFNGSPRTITYTSFYLSAQRPGHTVDLAEFKRQAEYVIPPNKRLFACAAPKLKPEARDEDLRGLEWGIGLTEVRFAD